MTYDYDDGDTWTDSSGLGVHLRAFGHAAPQRGVGPARGRAARGAPEQVPALRVHARVALARAGVRRATDAFKALALGATAVGIGRPSIYSLAAFGQPGVERMLQIFKDELTMVMRLMGTPSVNWITEDHVLTRNLADHFAAQPRDSLLNDEYEPLRTAAAMRGKL